jgi:hypothetical protein
MRFILMAWVCIIVVMAVGVLPRTHHLSSVSEPQTSYRTASAPEGVGLASIRSQSHGFTLTLPYTHLFAKQRAYDSFMSKRGDYTVGQGNPTGDLVVVGAYRSAVYWFDYGMRAAACDEFPSYCPTDSYEQYSMDIATGNPGDLDKALYERPFCNPGQLQGMWHFLFQGYQAMFQRCSPGNATNVQSEFDMLVVVRGSYRYKLSVWGPTRPPFFARRFLDSFRFVNIAPGSELMPPLGRVGF